MAWWRNLLGMSKSRSAAPAGTAISDGIVVASTSARGAPRRGTRELMIAYREQPWLRAVAGRIARGIASLDWKVYVRVEEPMRQQVGRARRAFPDGPAFDVTGAPAFRWGKDRSVRDVRLISGSARERAARRRELADAGLLREVPDHPILELLAHPNEEITGRASLQMTQTWIDLKGEAFWMLAVKNGTPSNYLALPPHWVTQVPTKQQPYFRLSYQSLQVDVPANRMVWLRDPDPENPYGRGTGVAEALGDELETDEYAAKYVKNWFFNNGMPSAIVSFEGADQAAVKRAEEKWAQSHSGYMNAHRVHFAGGKMNAQKLDASFKEQEIGPLRKGQRDTVVQVFGVPPEMVGIIENSNRSTIDGAGYIYAMGVEFPRAEFLRTELQQKLVTFYDEDICLDAAVQVPEDANRRLDVMKAMPTAFLLNEWREEGGRDPLPELEGKFPAAMPGQDAPAGGDDDEKPEEPEEDEPKDEPEPEPEGEAKALPVGDPPWVAELAR